MSLLSQSWEPPSALEIQTSILLPSLLLLLLPSVMSFSPRLLPPSLRRRLPSYPSYLKPFVTLDDIYPADKIRPKRTGWKTVVLSLAAFVQLQSLCFGSTWTQDAQDRWSGRSWIVSGLLGACWVYAGVYPLVVRRTSTANYSLLFFYLLQLLSSSLTLLAPFYLNSNARVRFSDLFAILMDLLLVGTTLTMQTEDLPSFYIEDQQRLVAEGSKGL